MAKSWWNDRASALQKSSLQSPACIRDGQSCLPAPISNPGNSCCWRRPRHRRLLARRIAAEQSVYRYQTVQGLKGDNFQHQLDRQNTRLLSALPGLGNLAYSIIGPVAEKVLLLENLGCSVLVAEDQLPSLHALISDAARLLQMPMPDLYVKQNPTPNAYTLAISGRKPFIVVHTALLELLTPAEMQAVIAHELGHLKCSHGLWLTVANILASSALSVLPVISAPVEEALMRWLRSAELTCDRAALLVTQDAKVVVSTLMKLAGGSPAFSHELNVEAFLRQARSYDDLSNTFLGWYLKSAQTRAASHPLPVLRAREIDAWSRTKEYAVLLSSRPYIPVAKERLAV